MVTWDSLNSKNFSKTNTFYSDVENDIVNILIRLRLIEEAAPTSYLYDKLKYDLIDKLCRYALVDDTYIKNKFKQLNHKEYTLEYSHTSVFDSEYGVEIFQVATDCVKSFSGEPEFFLIYYNSSLNQKFKQAAGKKAYQDMHSGIKSKIKPSDFDYLNKFKPLTIDKNFSVSDDPNETEQFLQFLKSRNYTLDDVFEFWFGSVSIDSTLKKEESDPKSEKEAEPYSAILPDTSLTQEELQKLKSYIDTVEEAYKSNKVKNKPLFSMLFTARLLETALDYYTLLDYLQEASFFNLSVYDYFRKNYEIPKDNWIAQELNIYTSSVSRSLGQYRIIIQNLIC